MSASITLGADQPDLIQCRLLSAANDWDTTDKIYELKATSTSGSTRSWLINPEGEMNRDILIDGEWSAEGTVYDLSFTDQPDIAIAYSQPGCQDDDISLAFSQKFPGFAPGDQEGTFRSIYRQAAKSFKIVRMEQAASLDFSQNSGLTDPTNHSGTECYDVSDNKVFAGFV